MKYGRIAAASALISVVLTTTAMQPALAKTRQQRVAATAIPNPSPTSNVLDGVSVDSATDAWAVGSYLDEGSGTYRTLILHWDGAAWSRVRSPNPSPFLDQLNGVSADSPTDAWAVGFDCPQSAGCFYQDTLVLHWDGLKWSRVPSPNPNKRDNILTSVSANSPTDVWAVGSMRASRNRTLIVHWDGIAWSQVASPNPGSDSDSLSSVSADSSTDAWAAGSYSDGSGSRTLVEHWDGVGWSKVRSPNPGSDSFLAGVSASSESDALAVGASSGSVLKTLALHWDGSTWSKVRSPNPSGDENVLKSVVSLSPAAGWAAGYFQDLRTGALRTLIAGWDGRTWSRFRAPSPSSTFSILFAAGASSETDAWAVGYYDTGSPVVSKNLILHWDGTRWSKS